MTRLLSNLVDNLAQEIHKIKYKHGHDNKKEMSVVLNTKN